MDGFTNFVDKLRHLTIVIQQFPKSQQKEFEEFVSTMLKKLPDLIEYSIKNKPEESGESSEE